MRIQCLFFCYLLCRQISRGYLPAKNWNTSWLHDDFRLFVLLRIRLSRGGQKLLPSTSLHAQLPPGVDMAHPTHQPETKNRQRSARGDIDSTQTKVIGVTEIIQSSQRGESHHKGFLLQNPDDGIIMLAAGV